MNSSVAVVSINLQPWVGEKSKSSFKKYNSKTTREKVDHMVDKIEQIAASLEKNEPHSQWLIAWREYGITDADSRYIKLEDKKYLKERMEALTKKYEKNNLTIVSGTVATKKTITSDSKKIRAVLEVIKNYYEEYTLAIDDEDEMINQHLQAIEELLNNDEIKAIEVIRNTAYVFSRGKCIFRHDKSIPHLETINASGKDWWRGNSDEIPLLNTVFRPGNKKNSFGVFSLPEVPGVEPIVVGLETCKEHQFATFKKNALRSLALPKQAIDLHLLLSFGMDIELPYLHGKNFVHCDSVLYPKHIVTNEDYQTADNPIHLYEYDGLVEQAELSYPLDMYCPPELEIINLFADIVAIIQKNKHFTTELNFDLTNNVLDEFYQTFLHNIDANKEMKLEECDSYQKKLDTLDHFTNDTKTVVMPMITQLTQLIINLPLITKTILTSDNEEDSRKNKKIKLNSTKTEKDTPRKNDSSRFFAQGEEPFNDSLPVLQEPNNTVTSQENKNFTGSKRKLEKR